MTRSLRRWLAAGTIATLVAGLCLSLAQNGAGASADSLGDKIAFTRSTPIGTQVFTVNADGSGVSQVTSEIEDVGKPSWRGDGARLAYDASLKMFSINADGSDRAHMFDSELFLGEPAWSPDGSSVAFFDYSIGELVVVNAAGGNRKIITSGSPANVLPAWSPDGSTIAFSRNDQVTYAKSLWLSNADGTNPRQLVPESYDAGASAFAPDGQSLAFSGIGPTPETGRIHLVQIDGSDVHAIGPVEGVNHSPTFSPQGTKIAFIQRTKPNGVYQSRLWVMNADGTDAHQLIEGDAFTPAWQPTTTPPTTTTTTTTTTVVLNQRPVAEIALNWTEPLTISVGGNYSTDADGSIVAYQWNWGDLTPATKSRIATHRYAKPGDYLVKLTVTDNVGAKAITSIWVRVR